MIINYASRVINKLEAFLTDDHRVVIYDRHVFIVQATGGLKPLTRDDEASVLPLYFHHPIKLKFGLCWA